MNLIFCFIIGFIGGFFFSTAISVSDKTQAVSPDEVRGVGKWTNRRTIEHDGEYWCTACGKEITIYMGVDRKDRYNYCPNCGAKMEVTDDA